MLKAKNNSYWYDRFILKTDKTYAMCPAMENDLATWVLEQREKVVCLDQYEIQKKSLHFYDLIHPVINSVDIMPIVVSIFQPPASYEAQPPASYEYNNEWLKWLDEIWDNFNSDALRRSFECCGIGITPNNGNMQIKTDVVHSALRKLLLSKDRTIPNNCISTDIEEVEAEDQMLEYGEDLFENPEDGEFVLRDMDIEHLNPVRIEAEASSEVIETSPIVIDENNNYLRRSQFDISKYYLVFFSIFSDFLFSNSIFFTFRQNFRLCQYANSIISKS
jgi:hypothetical protein